MSQSQIDQIALSLNAGRRMTGRCCICAHKVFSSHSIYCRRCYLFSRRMNQRGLHADAVKSIWKYVRKHGYVCYYTGIKLDMTDPTSPWYYVFDHRIPGDDRTVVLTFALLNEMKSDQTDKEFYYNVRQLFKNKYEGCKFRKKRLGHWQRFGPLSFK